VPPPLTPQLPLTSARHVGGQLPVLRLEALPVLIRHFVRVAIALAHRAAGFARCLRVRVRVSGVLWA
jgi:hypothetical protein